MPLKLKKIGKVWYIHGSVHGQRIRESARTDSREHAEAKRKELQRDLEDKIYLHDKTFLQAIDMYLEKGGEGRFLAPIHEKFGTYKLRDVTAEAVSRGATELYPDHEPSTVKRQYYVPMNAIMRTAHEAGWCHDLRFKAPKVKRKPVDYADALWFKIFHANAGPRISLFLKTLFTTGARVSEICQIAIRDLNFDHMTITLRRTKSGKSRTIKMAPEAMQAIGAWLHEEDLRRQLTPESNVFGYANRFSVNQAIRRVCARVNKREGHVVLRYLSSHKCGRHAFAYELLSKGESLKTVQEMGGWGSIKVLNDNYGHLERSHVDSKLVDLSYATFAEKSSPLELQNHAQENRQESGKAVDDDELARSFFERVKARNSVV